LVHSRKYGWDVYFLCQNPMQIDRQVRESLLEFSCRMKKLDRVLLPVIGGMLARIGFRGTYPRGTHSARITLGFDEHQAALVETVVFKGEDLHAAYDTRHIFIEDPEQVTATWLGPKYFLPLPPRPATLRERIAAALRSRGASVSRHRASLQPRTWPASVTKLPPELRWQIARRLCMAP
jgi:hypothetical protein